MIAESSSLFSANVYEDKANAALENNTALAENKVLSRGLHVECFSACERILIDLTRLHFPRSLWVKTLSAFLDNRLKNMEIR
jgi:hypothetical protein